MTIDNQALYIRYSRTLPFWLENLLFIIFFLDISRGASFVSSSIWYASIFIFISVISFAYKIRLEKLPIYIVLYWVLVNLVSRFYNSGMPFDEISFIGHIMRILLPFMLFKLIGDSFLQKLIKWIYLLTIVSFFFYIIDISVEGVFRYFPDFLNVFTREQQAESGGLYLFVYMKSAWVEIRNCGFMWEPGAFAGILIIAIAIRLSQNNFKLDKYVIIFIIGIITTYSTAGYIAMYFLIVAILLKRFKKNYLVLFFALIPLIVYVGIQVYKLDFVSDKIYMYLNTMERLREHSSGRLVLHRVAYSLEIFYNSLNWPFGNGVSENIDLYTRYYGLLSGSSSLAIILFKWGWIGLIMFIIFIYRFIKSLNPSKGKLTLLILTGSVLIIFYSNPLDTLAITFMFVYVRNNRYSLYEYKPIKNNN